MHTWKILGASYLFRRSLPSWPSLCASNFSLMTWWSGTPMQPTNINKQSNLPAKGIAMLFDKSSYWKYIQRTHAVALLRPTPPSESCCTLPWTAFHPPQTGRGRKWHKWALLCLLSCWYLRSTLNSVCSSPCQKDRSQQGNLKAQIFQWCPAHQHPSYTTTVCIDAKKSRLMPSTQVFSESAAKLPLHMLLSWQPNPFCTAQKPDHRILGATSRQKAHLPILRILVLFLIPLGACRKRAKFRKIFNQSLQHYPQIDILRSAAGSNVSCTVPGGPSYFMTLLLILINFRGERLVYRSTHPHFFFAEGHVVWRPSYNWTKIVKFVPGS